MYFNTKQATTRSVIFLVVIFIMGLNILDSVFVDTDTTPLKTVNIFYYNVSKDTSINGISQCDVMAIDSVVRVITESSTTTEMYIDQVLSKLFFTPLNPIEMQFGFTKNNIPTDIVVDSIHILDSIAEITLILNRNQILNECEDKILRGQITKTINQITDISTSTVHFLYKKF